MTYIKIMLVLNLKIKLLWCGTRRWGKTKFNSKIQKNTLFSISCHISPRYVWHQRGEVSAHPPQLQPAHPPSDWQGIQKYSLCYTTFFYPQTLGILNLSFELKWKKKILSKSLNYHCVCIILSFSDSIRGLQQHVTVQPCSVSTIKWFLNLDKDSPNVHYRLLRHQEGVGQGKAVRLFDHSTGCSDGV